MRRVRAWKVAWLLMVVAAPLAAQQAGHVNSLARLRAGPGDEYRLGGGGHAGNPVTVYGCLENGSWCDVRGSDGRGWMRAQAIGSGRGGVTTLVPKVTFALDAYWDAHYRGREWTAESERALWRAHVPGESLSLDLMAPGNGPSVGEPTIAKRLKDDTRSENERTERQWREKTSFELSRLDRNTRDDRINGCKRAGGGGDAVQDCVLSAKRDYYDSVRSRCNSAQSQDSSATSCLSGAQREYDAAIRERESRARDDR